MGRLGDAQGELTRERFQVLMDKLNGLKFRPVTLDTHWLGLQGFEPDDVEAAVDRAAVECVDFPPPKMLRAFISDRRDQQQRVAALERMDRETPVTPRTIAGTPIKVEREWTYYCQKCSDSGWLGHWCGGDAMGPPKPWLIPRQCERRNDHAAHEWVALCACVESNPDVPAHVKQRARTQQQAR